MMMSPVTRHRLYGSIKFMGCEKWYVLRYSVEVTRVGFFQIPRLIVEIVMFVRSSLRNASVILRS
jgi:hypothetical protein